MTRNTFFAVMMAATMAMFANEANAQGRSSRGGSRGYNTEMGSRGNHGSRSEGYNFSHDGGSRRGDYNNYGPAGRGGYDNRGNAGRGGYDNRGNADRGGRNGYSPAGRRGHGGYEMNGHRWSHDGWLEGYHGRVRHFSDGRWGYYRDGAWLYYDCFYEPAYYYAHPVAHFHGHLLSPRGRRVARAAVGTAIAVGVIGSLCY